MNSARFLLILLFSLIFLIVLQSVWLNYTYQKSLNGVKGAIDTIFFDAIEKELSCRFIEMELAEEEFSEDTIVAVFEMNQMNIEESGLISQQYTMLQKMLAMDGFTFNLSKVDSIFQQMLSEQNIQADYDIFYTDSLQGLIQSTGREITRGFQTNFVPIYNGTKAQAILEIYTPTIFRNMLGILIVSLFVLILIIIGLIYVGKLFSDLHYINNLRENFTEALTHNMKTPLATAQTVLDQMKKGNLDDKPQMKDRFLQIAIEQNKNMQIAIDQMLIAVSTDKKQFPLNKQKIDIPLMIDNLINNFSIKEEKEIRFSQSYMLNQASVYADSFYLSNAISNLIDNAVKYSGISVDIQIECINRDGYIHFCVKDNGFGVPQKDQLKIFEKFERGPETKKKRINGFGIGLNYVKTIAEIHDGTVTISSREGEGSVFSIILPSIQIGPTHDE